MTASKYCCPTCGHPLLPTDPLAILKPMQRRIFEVIYAAGVAGITKEALTARVYANRTDGGASKGLIPSHRTHINARIRFLGLQIAAADGRLGRYRIVNLKTEGAKRLNGARQEART